MTCGSACKKLRQSSWACGSPVLRLVRLSLAAANVLLLLLLLVSSPPSYSQEITGTVTVVVQDRSGAAVPALTRIATGEKTSGFTNNVGSYTYNLVQPGAYRLTATADGFATLNITNIIVSIGEHITIPVQLSVGSLTQSVAVSAESASLLNSESPSVGQTIQSQPIQDLPLNGRNFVQLLYLTTGALPVGQGDSPASTWTGRSNVTVILGGLRETDTSYLINGIETRNSRFGNAGLFLSPDAIQEFRVQRTTFGAEFGHSASIVTCPSAAERINFTAMLLS
jgi:hypothetical protein